MSKAAITEIKFEVNKAEDTIVVEFAKLCPPAAPINDSPIDDYYHHTRGLFKLSAHPDLQGEPALIRLLLLGLVSAVEFYFRSVLAGVIDTCPLSREKAARHQLTLASVDYYSRSQLGYALMENRSFSTEGEIKTQTQNLAGVSIPDGSSVAAAIKLYDSVCHLRHAAIHSRGELNAKNAKDLGLPSGQACYLELSALDFQQLMGVCNNAVRAYNRFLFASILKRWIVNGFLTGEWEKDEAQFSALFKLFVSTEDGVAPASAEEAFRLVEGWIKKVVTVREGGVIVD